MIIALLGNPNSGKTTLFNALTGMRRHVGNFPGVTVERMEGPLREAPEATLVDLPGTYSLTALSAEEEVSRDFLVNHPPDVIIDILDATCPERGLYLTLQLLETGIPLVVALNMMDEVRAGGGSVDATALSEGLGVPVLPVTAARGEGVAEVARAALGAARRAGSAHAVGVADAAEAAVIARYARIESLCARAFQSPAQSPAQRLSVRVDRVLTNRVFAFPIFFAVMGFILYLTFGPVGGTLSRAFSRLLGSCAALLGQGLSAVSAPAWLRGMLLDGVMAGVGTVFSFLPTIVTLFFFLSLLEDSGYMARMAFVTDGLLRKIGLSGRSFVPALLGLGCSVPAILATRTLSSRRDRCMTILLVPFLSCSAKLPIYTMFARAFFPDHAVLVMIALYMAGVLAGILVALLLRKTAFHGQSAPFLLELPAYRMPGLRSALMLVRVRTGAFVRCAATTLLIASVGVWALQHVDWAARPVMDNADSALASIGRAVAPLFLPLGFGDWRPATALLAGLMAKEGVLSSMSILLGASTEWALHGALRAVFTPLSAVSFLTFTLLYMPCVAAFAAARREFGGLRYAVCAAVFQTGVAWLAACLVYNIGRMLGFS